jgi:hypothetical protein
VHLIPPKSDAGRWSPTFWVEVALNKSAGRLPRIREVEGRAEEPNHCTLPHTFKGDIDVILTRIVTEPIE